MIKISKSAVLLSAIALGQPACSLQAERPPLDKVHDFGPAEKMAAVGATNASGWSAVTVTAPQWLQNDNIRYRQLYADPTRTRFYTLDSWLAAPSAMLAQRLNLAAGGQGWRLKITLLELEQVFDAPQMSRAIMVFRATALSTTGDAIIAEKLFNLSTPAASADAQGAVSASARLADEAVDALHGWLAGLAVQP
jgi:cholesterol transport system auxiliary component